MSEISPLQPKILHPDTIKPFKGVCGRVWQFINPETAPTKALSTALIAVEPRERSTPHYHRVTEEIYFIIDGEGVLRTDNQEYPIKQDSIAYIPPNVPHSLINTGKKTLKLLVIDHPPYNRADTIMQESAGE